MVLPSVVDISTLYGNVNYTDIWEWSWAYQQQLPIGQVAGISDADALLAYALGQRLGVHWRKPLPITPVTVSLPSGPFILTEPATPAYDQIVQVPFLQTAWILPSGLPLAVTFTLAGDMCAPAPTTPYPITA